MLKKIIGFFKKKDYEEERLPSEIELSKIDKHMNFMLRDKLGMLNRIINEKIVEIGEEKDQIMQLLRTLHKKPLMNPNISQREIQIMEGNRENFIKRVSHFVINIDLPKNYLETHDYCIRFSQEMEQLFKDVQKNIYILRNFFENEIKGINKELTKTEQLIIDIRATFEKNNIDMLKDMQVQIKQMTKNILRIKSIEEEIATHQAEIKTHEDKLLKLNERIQTITSGTDYRMLESFKEEKDKVDDDISASWKKFESQLSELDTALKKYAYRNPDKKIIKSYMDHPYETFLEDHSLELATALKEIKELTEQNVLELKDKKKETTIQITTTITSEYLKGLQSELKVLEEHKHRTQSKITHNSAALNLSEQQYWINATKDKIKYHQAEIDKREKDINNIIKENEDVKQTIKQGLESLTGENVIIKDDLNNHITQSTVENIEDT